MQWDTEEDVDSGRVESPGNSTTEEEVSVAAQLACRVTLNETSTFLRFAILVTTPIPRG